VCTILFSDVVTFTSICSACEPIHIVHLLNSMYSKFDRLTSIHDIYKVCVSSEVLVSLLVCSLCLFSSGSRFIQNEQQSYSLNLDPLSYLHFLI